MPDWKRIAAERLQEIRRLRAQIDAVAKDAGKAAWKATLDEIHGRCLASVNSDAWRECLTAIERRVRDAVAEQGRGK